MRIAILSFSSEGQLLGRRLREALEGRGSDCTLRRCPEGGLREWTQNHFLSNDALIFVGSCGLAVRAIAPFVQSKSSDPAVLVIDETGKFVISLLSGHLGGANELTKWVAEELSATPVITTATDRRGLFAVDSWARRNGYFVSNPEKIKAVSAALLEGKTVTFCSDFPISGKVPGQLRLLQRDCSEAEREAGEQKPGEIDFSVSWQRRESEELRIVVPSLYIGIGARKGISSEAVEQLVDHCLKELKASPLAVKAVASIDLKANEEGIFECCARHAWTFLSFSQEELARVEGDFSASAFVKEVTGVDNVCERSAVLAAGQGSRLLLRKQSLDGVTCAIALEAISLSFDTAQPPQP
ncbi:MAG: cobalt-precorrin 5A hydrolase [Clostridiales bacterium]|nr:cobalt-precorrin 5A hydrolase [Clostridiales bacterium]MDD7433299.1 cobalt-precorrin 5A hydrolase [Clostridiales bacterium]MDY3062031.1 cobalt-precorrin 5A hydrolase [Eubacteriales bacterium]